MSFTQELLSDIVVYNKYAKYVPELNRRETWNEIVDRYLNMMTERYPELSYEIKKYGEFLHEKKVLMSMRAAQFAGKPILKNNARIYNCCYLPINHYKAFSEIMFLLLSGTGVGFSVQGAHIAKLPKIKKPTQTMKYLVSDDIEGWANAVNILFKAYFGLNDALPIFDFSDIRAKGERLITSGGKAPGPDPLRECLIKLNEILSQKENGEQLSDIEVHDLVCHIANSVLAGGIRRSALISLFDKDSEAMLTCKHGEWWVKNPQRGRANNSAMLNRATTTKEEFDNIFTACKNSFAGEPGMFFTDDDKMKYGTNPCAEISLREFSFCNLTEINAGNIKSKKDFQQRVRAAAFFGTLQAGFVDFHYLRSIWKKNTMNDSLIGIGITGICNGDLIELDKKHKNILKSSARLAKRVNKYYASKIGIRSAARVTTIKPSGTTSCVLSCSSGIHAWHSEKYIRNMQCAVGDDLYNYFMTNHPELIKVMDYDPKSAVIGIPQISPSNAIIRNAETALDFVERVKKFNVEWVQVGHRRGPNFNNVSATISVKDNEWDTLQQWMWDNRTSYNGLSILPYDGGTYADAPFQEVSDEVFNRKLEYILNNDIDLTMIEELVDNTTLSAEVACAGGQCEINI